MDTPLYQGRRRILIEELAEKKRFSEKVLKAIGKVPRHLFVESGLEDLAYQNSPVAIGANQTISQPSTVALQTELLALKSGDKILEIGTGCGYQSAILYYLGARVFSIERQESLFYDAQSNLKKAGFCVEECEMGQDNFGNKIAAVNSKITLIWGDGFEGYPSEAPFDGIIVTCAAPAIPEKLLKQVKIGGRIVIPVGEKEQTLQVLIRKGENNYDRANYGEISFVPMLEGKSR